MSHSLFTFELLNYSAVDSRSAHFNWLCTLVLCWKVYFISPLNDAEDDNGTAQLEEDSVDQNRAAEVEYTSISNTYLPMDFPSNTSTSKSSKASEHSIFLLV